MTFVPPIRGDGWANWSELATAARELAQELLTQSVDFYWRTPAEMVSARTVASSATPSNVADLRLR